MSKHQENYMDSLHDSIEPVAWRYWKTGQVFSLEPPPGMKAQCDELVPASALAAAVLAERERILNCYSPDDTVNDYQDKIRGNV